MNPNTITWTNDREPADGGALASDAGPRARLRRRARLRAVWRMAVWFAWIWPGSLTREDHGVWRIHGQRGRRRFGWRAAMALSQFMTFAWPTRLSPGRWGMTCRSRPLLLVWWPGLGGDLARRLDQAIARVLDWATRPFRRAMMQLSRLWTRPMWRRGAIAGLACLASAGALAATTGLFTPGPTSTDGGRANRLGIISNGETPGGGAAGPGEGGAPSSDGAGGGAGGADGAGGAGGGGGGGAGGPSGDAPGVTPFSEIADFGGGGGGGGGDAGGQPGADGGEPQAQPAEAGGVDASEGGGAGGAGGSGGGSGGGGGAGGVGGGAGGSGGGGDTSSTDTPPNDGGLVFLDPPPSSPGDPGVGDPAPPVLSLLGDPPEQDGRASPGDGDGEGPGQPTFNLPAIAAPEPATWLMMVLGFSAMGSALRAARRRPRLAD